MADNEFTLKEMIEKLSGKVDSLIQSFNDYKIESASNLLTKVDCEKCKKEKSGSHTTIREWLLGIIGFATAIAIAIFKK
jgi:hypothetical protein